MVKKKNLSNKHYGKADDIQPNVSICFVTSLKYILFHFYSRLEFHASVNKRIIIRLFFNAKL